MSAITPGGFRRSVRVFGASRFPVCMAAGLVILMVSQAGCSKKRFHKSPWLVTEGDVGRYLVDALEHDNADVRRDALAQISKTRYANHDTVIDACSTIAATDRSASVRAAAIRRLAESMRPDVPVALLDILDREDQSHVTGPRVCVDVLHALYFLERNGAILDAHRDRVVQTAVRLLRNDPSRDVNIAAARVLEGYPRLATVDALIVALNHQDFGVVYQAQRSLIHLTGVRHNHDPDVWRTWLASTDAPFAMRGRLDEELEPPAKPKWWQRVGRSIKSAFTGLRQAQKN